MGALNTLFYIFIFPGFLFLLVYALVLQWIDRKLIARLQNRIGPPFLQPLADMIKLFSKEDITPEKAEGWMVSLAPILGLASVLTAALFIPMLSKPLYSFPGDVIIIAYLLSIPAFALFVTGWYSTSHLATIGAMRTMMLFFSYEVPLVMSILGPALLCGSWDISKIILYQQSHTWMAVLQPLGLCVALIALVGKLERIPFDIPEAETEIVEGPLCEVSGRKLAFFRLIFDLELVIGASLVGALYLGGFADPIMFFIKTLAIVFVLSLTKAVFARLRIDQMIEFCWKFMVPIAILQIFLVVLMKIRA